LQEEKVVTLSRKPGQLLFDELSPGLPIEIRYRPQTADFASELAPVRGRFGKFEKKGTERRLVLLLPCGESHPFLTKLIEVYRQPAGGGR
jgi:hypothetical protein